MLGIQWTFAELGSGSEDPRAERVLCPEVLLSTDALTRVWTELGVMEARRQWPPQRLGCGLDSPVGPSKPLGPTSRGCPQPPRDPGELGKGEPRPAPPASPQALPPMLGPSARTLVSGAGDPPGCYLGLPPCQAPWKPVSVSRGRAMQSPHDLRGGRGACPRAGGEDPGAGREHADGHSSAPSSRVAPLHTASISLPAESMNRSGKGPSPSGANVSRNDVHGHRPRAGGC